MKILAFDTETVMSLRTQLPPKKMNWVPGTPQIGAFLRTAKGGSVELISNQASEREALLVEAIFYADKLPESVFDNLRAAMASR